MEYYLKIYKSSDEYLIAVCDKDILGETFKHNGVRIKVNEKFYGNISYTANEVLQEVGRASSINAMGKNVCQLLVENNFVHPQTILWFNNNDEKIGHVIILK